MSGNKSAFPWVAGDFSQAEPEMREGLTKRELFAAMMMQSFCTDANLIAPLKDIAIHAVRAADVLIEALNKEALKNG